ncbi:RNA-directed DNA polymerase, eukaryota, reverse transcriptase zinc-binding domain protein [Tanacetum coccineum]
MERGLRQGDPLSLLLFLLVAEGLQVTIIEACNKGIFKGVLLREGGDNIYLFQYADDVLFFGKVGVDIHEVESVASSINCSHGILPFMYLGLPVRKNMHFCNGWTEVIDRLRDRLSSWKAKNLSISGRLTLVKSVLGSVPLYFLSLFKAPLKGNRNGVFLQRLMLFGGSINNIDSSFSTSFNKKIVTGCNTLFWKDVWCKDRVRLMDRLPRLFALESNIDCFIFERWAHINGVWRGVWMWRIPPRGRSLDDALDASGVLKVKTLSNLIQDKLLADSNLGNHHTWNSWVPNKVNVYVWRASLDRLPSRVNLVNRGVNLVSKLCPFCELEDETLEHCLIKYSHVQTWWHKVWSWLRFNTTFSIPHVTIKDIAAGNVGITGNHILAKIFHGVFQCVLWAIWRWRNKVVNSFPDSVIAAKSDDVFPSIQRFCSFGFLEDVT